MKAQYKSLLYVCLLLALPVVVQAQSQEAPKLEEEMLTGAELLDSCRPGVDSGNGAPPAYCMEFVLGLVQTLASLQEMMPEADKLFCIDPKRIGLEAVTRNVTSWLEAHPERLDEPAFLLTSKALHDNYPCPDSQTPEQPSP